MPGTDVDASPHGGARTTNLRCWEPNGGAARRKGMGKMEHSTTTSVATRWTATAAALAMLLGACTGGGPQGSMAEPTGSATASTGSGTQARPASFGGGDADAATLGFRLSEGAAQVSSAPPPDVVAGTPLTAAEVTAVLDRLPEWDVPADDVSDFERPVDSLQPPTVGDTVDAPFPAVGDLTARPATPGPSDGSLEVLRFQPDGDVDVAPFIAITFDEPMIPLATLDQLDAADVPVTITPDIADTAGIDGRWRWIGTRTLRFEVTPQPTGAGDGTTVTGNGGLDRLPAATDYTVTVPAGTESATGAVLDGEVSFTFSTPAATVTSLSGLGESMGLDPVFVATFDQRVDAADVVAAVSIEAGRQVGVRLATSAEIDADPNARAVFDGALDDRAVAFVPTESLPTDTAVTVTVGPGVASLEGPRTSTATTTETGRTFGPLQIVRSECFDDCAPFTPFSIEFSNELDRAAFDPSWVTVSPALPGVRVDNFGAGIQVRGSTAGNTTYTVTIDADLVDRFGQTLGEDATRRFDVGDPRPLFIGPNRQFVTVDPFVDEPGLSFTTIGHERIAVTAWQVDPAEYREFESFLESTYSDTLPDDPDWPVVLDTTVDVAGDVGQMAETFVELGGAFTEADGDIVVRAQPESLPAINSDDWWQNRPTYTWVQDTDLGVDVFVVDDELLVWVTSLLTGEPIDGASIRTLGPLDTTLTTDAGGVARIELDGRTVTALQVDAGDVITTLPGQRFGGWQGFDRTDQSRFYVTDDRGVYRPGETARLTGLIRSLTADDAQIELPDSGALRWMAYDPQGNELGNGVAELNAVGGFNLAIEIPEASNTGQAFVDLGLVDDVDSTDFRESFGHQFLIADFRTPEFEVDARNESTPPFYVVDPATVAVDANYFAGGPLADAEVNWQVSARDTSYAPPGWTDYAFGVWTPWWFGGGFDDFGGGFGGDVVDECFDCFPGGDLRIQQYTGRTDAGGTHRLQIDFTDIPAASPGDGDEDAPQEVDQPTSIVAESTVFDVNRQAISSRVDLIVHPAQYYVGLRSDRGFVESGDPIVIDTTVVDVDGTAVAGRDVIVTAGRVDQTFADGRYVEEIVDEQTCEVTSSDVVVNTAPDAAMRCEFATEVGGEYRITGIVTDGDGRSNRAVYTQYVSGGSSVPVRNLERGDVLVVPDAEFHAPGDIAELLVQAPFAPASGLVTVTRAGIETVEVFDAPDGSAVVEVPIADDDIPNLNVRVDMVGTDTRRADDGTDLVDAPLRPAFAVGQIELNIPPTTRTLTVDAVPADEQLAPGAATSVTVSVNDADGAPVADAGVALIVVDEAVLSLSGYELPDPLDAFYAPLFTSLDASLIRDSIILSNPEAFAESGDTFGGEDAMEEEAMEESAASDGDFATDDAAAPVAESRAQATTGTPIEVREDFDALAVFAPDETTGADGTVTIDVDLPDNLTRYRVMAIAAAGADRFGSDESAITAALPVSVRPSAPRFLNFGDRFELPVVVQNRTDAAVDVDVAIETANLSLTDGAGRRVTVPANGRVEVRFPAEAAAAGTARFRVASVGGEFADAATVALPVYTPATSEAFATYGVIDSEDPIAQPLQAPDGVIPQFGGLEISTSSTALQALTDAVLYLYDYRYDSADGYASRIMAVAALRDVLDAFDADGLPDADALNVRVQEDLAALSALQNDDGGFPSWQRGRPSDPYVTVQATHALVLARDAGYAVEAGTLDVALDALRRIEQIIPTDYSDSIRDSITAYALYVRNLAGDADPRAALDLYRSGDDTLELDSIARLWTVIDDEEARADIADRIDDATVETAGAATFATSYGEDSYLIAHSDRRTDGVVLGALVTETPSSDLIPKVVTGLLGNQTRGRWGNAQENAFILLALNDYFDTFESVDPDFVARAWLGDTYAVESEFRGRSTDTNLSVVPMQELLEAGDVDLVLDKDGAGRLYYRFGLRYAPDDLDLDPRDEGFVVERRYDAIDDEADVVREADGSWTIVAGATVRVTVTMVADARRTNIALIDPLPAGLEAVNPALATSLTVPSSDPGVERTGSWFRGWFEHQNLRDDRVEAFTSFLPAGTYTYSYVARATTPGEFVVPPSRAEEIFAPEVFGRSSSDRVVIG